MENVVRYDDRTRKQLISLERLMSLTHGAIRHLMNDNVRAEKFICRLTTCTAFLGGRFGLHCAQFFERENFFLRGKKANDKIISVN